jgi:hypothetical protein
MSIGGHVSQRMLAHYSHVRIEAKRKAFDALATGGKTAGYDTNNDTKPQSDTMPPSQGIEKNGGDDETRTRDLCRDRLGIDVLSATYVLSGGCQVAEKDYRNRSLWVNLWLRTLAFATIRLTDSVHLESQSVTASLSCSPLSRVNRNQSAESPLLSRSTASRLYSWSRQRE